MRLGLVAAAGFALTAFVCSQNLLGNGSSWVKVMRDGAGSVIERKIAGSAVDADTSQSSPAFLGPAQTGAPTTLSASVLPQAMQPPSISPEVVQPQKALASEVKQPAASPSAVVAPTAASTAAPSVAVTFVTTTAPAAASPARGPRVHLLSHRSCSQDPKEGCNQEMSKLVGELEDRGKGVAGIHEIHAYRTLPPELMEDLRWKNHVVPHVRGRGYWFWKPAITNLLLEKGTIKDGDIVVWVDADSNIATRGTFLAQQNDKRGCDFLIQRDGGCEYVWTKGDIFAEFGVTPDDAQYGRTAQPKAQTWVARINERSRMLLKHWEDLATNLHLISDEPSQSPNSPKFRENRHDQSLISLLLKASDKSAASGCEANKVQWKMHPKYGVPGLKVCLFNL